MEQSEEPLGRRLRYAALDRVQTGSERVDDFVLDDDGVIDLRVFEHEQGGVSIAAPAAALASIRGQLGDAGEIADLYDESEPQRPRWRLGLRARHTMGADAPAAAPRPSFPKPVAGPKLPPISRVATIPLPARAAVDDDTAETPGVMPDIDLRNEDRPTAECPRCACLGHRDLFDRFSQVEFYSCDTCSHMWQKDYS